MYPWGYPFHPNTNPISLLAMHIVLDGFLEVVLHDNHKRWFEEWFSFSHIDPSAGLGLDSVARLSTPRYVRLDVVLYIQPQNNQSVETRVVTPSERNVAVQHRI